MRFRDRAVLIAALAALGAVNASGADAIRESLDRHWRRPLAPQGPPPARFSPLEASLQPEACGTCHLVQLADWKSSLHAGSMGPGVAGQLVEMLESDPPSALSCFTCHAPLAEQVPRVDDGGRARTNPAYDAALGARGLVCAGCHVRAHQRFGPPRRDGSLAPTAPSETLPHNGVTRAPAFLRSEFCIAYCGCNLQFTGRSALNGRRRSDRIESSQCQLAKSLV